MNESKNLTFCRTIGGVTSGAAANDFGAGTLSKSRRPKVRTYDVGSFAVGTQSGSSLLSSGHLGLRCPHAQIANVNTKSRRRSTFGKPNIVQLMEAGRQKA